jgi:hypothetical protein
MPGEPTRAHSTCLHVPSIGLIVGGDHPYLGEPDRQSRLEWISTLDKLEGLNPLAVIAGHKIPENPDDPRIIGETRKYLRDFIARDEATTTRQLYDAMLELYPDRANPGSLWGAANTAQKRPHISLADRDHVVRGFPERHVALRGGRCPAAILKHLAYLRLEPNLSCFRNHPDLES